MTGIVAHTYPEWWLKLAGQVAHWSTDYSRDWSMPEKVYLNPETKVEVTNISKEDEAKAS